MTTQDYILVARAFWKSRPPAALGRSVWTRVINAFMDEAEAQNPRFDREKFLNHCGVWRSNRKKTNAVK